MLAIFPFQQKCPILDKSSFNSLWALSTSFSGQSYYFPTTVVKSFTAIFHIIRWHFSHFLSFPTWMSRDVEIYDLYDGPRVIDHCQCTWPGATLSCVWCPPKGTRVKRDQWKQKCQLHFQSRPGESRLAKIRRHASRLLKVQVEKVWAQ